MSKPIALQDMCNVLKFPFFNMHNNGYTFMLIYIGDGSTCTAIDYCSPNPCDQTCEIIFGGYNCSCGEGYTVAANADQCDDVDECSAVTDPCATADNAYCVNLPGTYR